MHLQERAVKPHLPSTTLCVIDTTQKVHLASRAVTKCLEQATFGAVKLLTNNLSFPYAVKIEPLNGLAAYSEFCIKELHKHVDTPHVIVAQADGYMTRGEAWTDEFLNWDYIGSPWLPSNVNGNGGWSLRSKKLLLACARIAAQSKDSTHPEDAWISMAHRRDLESMGCRFAPIELARRWGFEGRSFDSVEWRGLQNKYTDELGFHSWLTPGVPGAPSIYHHSGESGDCIYGAAVIKALGGGVLFMSPHNNYPYPLDSRWTRTGGEASVVDNLRPLLEAQSYIDRVSYTHGTPHSCNFDLNKFRLPWKNRTAHDRDSILKLHCDAFNVEWDEKPWLEVKDPAVIPGRPICINRSPRYHNSNNFDWASLCQKHHDKMFFVGLEEEAHIFQGFAVPHKIPFYPTKNMLELGKLVAGCKVFVGNQSAALAIAHGLGKKVLVETWEKNSNCELNRPGDAIYWKKGPVEIPESWLI